MYLPVSLVQYIIRSRTCPVSPDARSSATNTREDPLSEFHYQLGCYERLVEAVPLVAGEANQNVEGTLQDMTHLRSFGVQDCRKRSTGPPGSGESNCPEESSWV